MCGIIGILPRPCTRVAPQPSEILSLLDAALAAGNDMVALADALMAADQMLRGDAGMQTLAGNISLTNEIQSRLDVIDSVANIEEARIDALHVDTATLDTEALRLSRVRDASWAIRRDRLRTADAVHTLAGAQAAASSLAGYLSIQQSLSAIDRMEVRGRDSAGISVIVSSPSFATMTSALAEAVAARSDDPLFTNRSVRHSGSTIVFVYKAAAEIGELGDNTRHMREAVASDDLLRTVLAVEGARTSVLGHTRWASVGIISEPNAHPVNGEEVETENSAVSVAVLNGDVDNHAELKVRHSLRFADPITTDAKVIPALVDRGRASGMSTLDAFLNAVTQFEGSVAIGYSNADEPEDFYLALHGSGQGLYVGLAEDRFIVASEPYGTVEETLQYVRLDGETPVHADQPSSRGQVMRLSAAGAGTLAGISMYAYDGTEISLSESNVQIAEVTTRDIDRGDAPHFLLKELGEAPRSFRKTIRGRTSEVDGKLVPDLDDFTLPASIIERLANRSITRIRIIGQGTAAVAGTSLVPVLNSLLDSSMHVEALTATELSGFGMHQDMSDMLVIAVSQSGTTTDTNRTVDLVASRGAAVLAIVNRRGSELASKAQGVYYTSDGRDVEMSVASTKAFYAQVAAGAVLSCAIARATGFADADRMHRILDSLVHMPASMEAVLAKRTEIGVVARQYAPSRRYWAVVGSGPNTVAANEVRIKLSELCYKSISCDVTEDKKHIDLSCEPMILVCAAGLADGTATDVAKEVAIFKAHKAEPIVVATEGETRFDAASAVITVPVSDPAIAFVLSSMVGHLFGYEAALAIDELARPLRALREVIDHVVERGGDGDGALLRVEREIVTTANSFFAALSTGQYNGNLEASTAVQVVSLLRIVTGPQPLQSYQRETGKVASPSSLLEDLINALTKAIDELTRPIDAIKHQAKTVTVGISRSEEGLLDRALVRAVIDAGAPRENLPYEILKVLAALDSAVESVLGFTRYAVTGDPKSTTSTISIVDRGGLARELSSRVEMNPSLVGTKRRVAAEQELLVARGRKDSRTVILVPEVHGSVTVGITLLHVLFRTQLAPAAVRQVLQGYDRRYDRLVDWVTETEGSFREERLGEVSIEDLLILPVSESANLWRTEV
ncbi:MAG: putative glucosamine-6-phosphate synthase [Actinomycetota bacterium]|jgi:glucosamine--fructose-6-phosphate aminotransferase (isomerizing)